MDNRLQTTPGGEKPPPGDRRINQSAGKPFAKPAGKDEEVKDEDKPVKDLFPYESAALKVLAKELPQTVCGDVRKSNSAVFCIINRTTCNVSYKSQGNFNAERKRKVPAYLVAKEVNNSTKVKSTAQEHKPPSQSGKTQKKPKPWQLLKATVEQKHAESNAQFMGIKLAKGVSADRLGDAEVGCLCEFDDALKNGSLSFSPGEDVLVLLCTQGPCPSCRKCIQRCYDSERKAITVFYYKAPSTQSQGWADDSSIQYAPGKTLYVHRFGRSEVNAGGGNVQAGGNNTNRPE